LAAVVAVAQMRTELLHRLEKLLLVVLVEALLQLEEFGNVDQRLFFLPVNNILQILVVGVPT
jgi:hypothetical protein